MALASTSQDDFSAGIFRGRKAPAASAYDLVNCLIDDTGLPFRRGGSSYFTDADAGVTLTTLADMYLAPGRRLLAWGQYPDAKLYILDEGAGTFTSLTPSRPEVASRIVQLGAIGVFQLSNGLSAGTNLRLYAGSMKTATYNTGTVAVAADAITLTGSGTSWLANVDVGMLFQPVSGGAIGVVAAVVSDTSITLREPWAGTTISGVGYNLAQHLTIPLPASAASFPAIRTFAASVGSPARLVFCTNNRAYFSDRGAADITTDQYHELPASEVIIGADSIDDTLLLFTTGGVWRVSNMAFDPVDAFGNQQHVVAEVSRDVILWGDAGIVGRENAFIVPAIDDVYLFAADGTAVPISGNIRPLYRSYVKAGYQPGVGVMHRGHYILPVLSGTGPGLTSALVDTLVFRLDREGTPVTRWAGHAASGAYARRAGSSTRSPQLLSIAGQRVTDLTDCFDPAAANATDADGTTSDLVIESRDFPTGQQPGFFAKARARYELEVPSVDDFDGGRGGPLTAPWLPWGGADMPEITSGVALPAVQFSDATRPESIDPDSFAEILFSAPIVGQVADDRQWGVGVRLSAHSVAADGYALALEDLGVGALRARLYKGSGFATLATGVSTAHTNVQGIRLVAIGTSIKGYFKIADVWTEVVSATDSTYAAAGFTGFFISLSSGTAVGVTEMSWGASEVVGMLGRVAVAFTSDADAGTFTTLTDRGEQGGAAGWGASDGSLYSWATVGKKRERGRLRITVSGACARFVLRSVELLIRQSGRQ